MKRFLLVAVAFRLTTFGLALAADPDSNLVVNGGFEDDLQGWQTTGDVHLETNSLRDGKASVIIGPGAGSLAQRIETGSGNAFTVSAILQSQRTNGWIFALRFLDKDGREVMKVDSLSDLKGTH